MARKKRKRKDRSIRSLDPKVEIGVANMTEAPGALRRMLRFSQLSVGEAGVSGRNIEDIWATFLSEMEAVGDEGAITRLKDLGAKKVLEESRIDKAVVAALGKNRLPEAKEILRAARASLKGVTPAQLKTSWGSLVNILAKEKEFTTEAGLKIIKELRKVDPDIVAKVGSNQVLSVFAKRGEDPFILRMFNKVFKKESTAALPEGMQKLLRDASKGKLPKVSGATIKALEKAGVATGTGLGRKALGLVGKTGFGVAGTGIFLGLEANRAVGILGREGRAKKLALQGFEGLGPSSSVDFLRDVVRKQEAVSRRKLVMQQYEPDMMQEIVRILSDTGQSQNTLTSTERRIGADAQLGVQRRGRSGEDVQFLLDQLFNQMGGVQRTSNKFTGGL